MNSPLFHPIATYSLLKWYSACQLCYTGPSFTSTLPTLKWSFIWRIASDEGHVTSFPFCRLVSVLIGNLSSSYRRAISGSKLPLSSFPIRVPLKYNNRYITWGSEGRHKLYHSGTSSMCANESLLIINSLIFRPMHSSLTLSAYYNHLLIRVDTAYL